MSFPRPTEVVRRARILVRRIAWPLLSLGIFIGVALVATRPLVSRLRTATLPGPDPLIDLWIINWLTTHLHAPSQLFQGNIYYPAEHAVLYSDISLGTAILVAPLRLIASSPLLVYNVAILVALVFGAIGFQMLAWELTRSRSASLLAGILTPFCSHQILHVEHLNLITIGWLPLFLLGLHRTLKRPSAGSVALTGVSFSLNAQSSGYFAVASVVLALVFAGVHLRRLLDRKVLTAISASVILAAILTLPYVRAFLSIQSEERLSRPIEVSAQDAFTPSRDLTSRTYVYTRLIGGSGQMLFPGVAMIVLAGFAVIRRHRGWIFYLAATLTFLILSLGPWIRIGDRTFVLPYAALFAVPPLNCMMHPYTFAAVATFCLAILASLGWSTLPLSRRAGAAVMALAVGLIETVGPPIPLRQIPPGVPPAYVTLKQLPEGAVLDLPFDRASALLWSAREGFTLLNGAGAMSPIDSMRLQRYIFKDWLKSPPGNVDDTRPAKLLRNLPVRYVIVPAGRSPEMNRLVPAFEASILFRQVARASDGDRIFEIVNDGSR